MATDSELMQGGTIIGQSLRQLGKDIKGDREEKRIKEQTKLLGEKFGQTDIGQTQMGQVVSLGLSNRLLDPDKSIGQYVGMPTEEKLKALITDANTIKDPAKMAAASKAIGIYASTMETLGLFEQRGKERAKWWGPEGFNARVNAANSKNENIKVKKGAPIDLSPLAEAFDSEFKDLEEDGDPILKVSTVGIPGFDGINKQIDINMNRPWPEIEVELRNSNVIEAGWFKGEDQKYTEEQIKSLKNYYSGFLIKKSRDVLQETNPLLKNPMLDQTLDGLSAAAAQRAFFKGVKGGLYVTDAEGKSRQGYKLDMGYIPEAVYLQPAVFEPSNPGILSASPSAQVQWLESNGIKVDTSKISSKQDLSDYVNYVYGALNAPKQEPKKEVKKVEKKIELDTKPKRIFMGTREKDNGVSGLGFKK